MFAYVFYVLLWLIAESEDEILSRMEEGKNRMLSYVVVE
jgi:hypothetical protein